MSRFLPLAVVIPLAGAVLTLATVRAPKAQRIIGVIAALGTLGMCIAIAVVVDRDGALHAPMGGWPAPIAINMVADRFAALMLVIGSAMLAAVLVFAIGARASDERSPWYQPAYMVLMAGVSAAFLAGDLFNFFVAVEILLMSSYVLITLEGVDDQIRSGTTYIVINVLESILLVMAVALVFAATGTLSMADLPERLAALPDGVKLGLNLLLLLAFGLKAAVFPLFSWLPDSYPAAPSPVTAVFAGLLTKIGVYAIVRTETLLFPGSLRPLLFVIAALTMVVGVLGAIAQSDMKRILSFHIVSQIGYMIMGLALGGVAAIAATIFFILHQIPVKTSLFLVEGIVERDTGSSTLGRVSGLARRSGWLALLFLLPALSLAGLPPFSGFIGKVGLAESAVGQSQWLMLGISLAVSVLTLVSMLKIWTGLFWGPSNTEGPPGGGILRHHPLMSSVTVAVVAVGLVITVAGGPIYRYCERAAESIVHPATYVATVNDAAVGDEGLTPMRWPALSRLLGPALLLVVWIALWGELSWANVISGLVVIPIVTFMTVRQPRAHRVHPLGVAKFAALFLKMLVDSSLAVARTSIRPTPERLRAGVVAVRLRYPTPLVATIVADAITLTPGTLTLDVSADSSTLYVHVLGIGDPDDVRADVADLERLVVGAVEPLAPNGAL